MKKLHLKTLPFKAENLLKDFQEEKPNFLKNFYLSGGTALSLQLGHRESVDLDFFNRKPFKPEKLQPELEKFGKLKDLELEENTLNAFLNGVQVQFLSHLYPLLEPPVKWKGVKISSVVDIGCTKMQTIGMRGAKKDFIDLYFILKKYSLKDLFEAMNKKYGKSEFNRIHVLKSLIYFKDADLQPMPRMHEEVEWREIKKEVKGKANTFSF